MLNNSFDIGIFYKSRLMLSDANCELKKLIKLPFPASSGKGELISYASTGSNSILILGSFSMVW